MFSAKNTYNQMLQTKSDELKKYLQEKENEFIQLMRNNSQSSQNGNAEHVKELQAKLRKSNQTVSFYELIFKCVI